MPHRLTKYQPLIDFLAACSEDDVTLTFADIEALIGLPLPDTARANNQYWVYTLLPHVRAWRALGWRAQLDRRDRRDPRVHFIRDTERK